MSIEVENTVTDDRNTTDDPTITERPKRATAKGGAKAAVQKDVIVKRRERRALGVFIDGPALDRAARRMNRKIELSALLQGVSSGITPLVARYYTLIPYEDDSRHRAFLDAVRSAGFRVIVKRLPPRGITRQVSVDVEMAVDIVAFGLGHSSFSGLGDLHPESIPAPPVIEEPTQGDLPVKRVVTVVCPSRELAYPLSLVKELGVDTASADFGKFNTGDILKSAAKWIDLSDSETIWRD